MIAVEKTERNKRLIELRRQGHSLLHIAGVFDITPERVRQIVLRYEKRKTNDKGTIRK